MRSELNKFSVAIGKAWWALMSCAAFTFLSLFAAISSKSNHWIIIATSSLAAIFFLVAAFSAWRVEHLARCEAQKELAACSVPNFELTLGQLYHTYSSGLNLTTVMIPCTITNHGATSHATGWTATLRRPTSTETVGNVNIPGEIYYWPTGQGKFLHLHKEKLLPFLTSSGVENGKTQSERILFEFSGNIANDLVRGAATLLVGCLDRTTKWTWKDFGRAYPTEDFLALPGESITDLSNEQLDLPG